MKDTYITMSNDMVFGPVIQGEGKYSGTKSVFLRMSGCNLKCAWRNKDGTETICDSSYTSFPGFEKNKTSVFDLFEDVKQRNARHVVITGGEPYIQKSLEVLVRALVDDYKFITIETNGTIYFPTKAQFISLSPKLRSSSTHEKFGEAHEKTRLNIDSLVEFFRNHKCQMKFVVNSEEDVQEIKDIRNAIVKAYIEKYPNEKLRTVAYKNEVYNKIQNSIWLMPQGITSAQLDDRMRMIIDICTTYGWSYSDRLHVRAYGEERRR